MKFAHARFLQKAGQKVMVMELELKEAFESVISQRGIASELGVTDDALRNLRRHFKNGKVSSKRMREILEAAGWKLVQVEKWENNKEI